MGLFSDAWDAIRGRSNEPTVQQRLEAQAQAQRDNDARVRFATQGTAIDLPQKPVQPSGAAVTAQAAKPGVPDNLKKEYQLKWQQVVQDEAGKDEAGQDAYSKLKELGRNIALISGNKKVDNLTDADFKAFGFTKDQYNTVLSRVAMNKAVSTFKGIADGSTPDLYNAMQDLEGILADTEYAKKGGMKHAREVMLSLSGTGISVAGFDDLKSQLGRSAAQEAGEHYKNTSGALQQLHAHKLLNAIKMSGEDVNDNSLEKYAGVTKEQFDKRALEQAMSGVARAGGDRHFEMFMNLSGHSAGKGR